jgi:glutathione S-transferase
MQIDERLSPVPALQQLRTLHPGSLQHLQQSSDGSLYPHHHQAVPQLHANNAVYQQYALSAPPQPPPHALHYQHHGLSGSPSQFTAFPATFQHPSSPQFAIASGPVAPPHPSRQRHQQPVPPPARPKPQQLTVQPFQPQIHQQLHGDIQGQTQAPGPAVEADEAPSSKHGQFEGLRLVANPPDLEAWRQKLFAVDDYITLNEEEYVF